MKTTVGLLLLILAGDAVAQQSQRYLVATRRPLSLTPAIRDIDFVPRDMMEFQSVNGFAATLTTDEVVALRRSRDVRYVERVAMRHLLGVATPGVDQVRNATGQTIPWGIDAVRAREVWPYTRGAGINVAVLDTGIDTRHQDLAGRYQGGFNAITSGNSEPFDDHGHGTHVSGTIVAIDDGGGVVGVAPQARLWAVKVLSGAGAGTSEQLIRGLDWVLAQKAGLGGHWVVNLSLGSDETNALEREAFRNAVDRGLLIFAASGNESTQTSTAPVGYPAAYPGVLAVGALTSTLAGASFSSQGPEVALSAPGVDVLSTVPLGTTTSASVQRNAERFSAFGVTGTKIGTVSGPFVHCGLGYPQSFPPAVQGKIALIKRGEITFAEKARNAKAAGATAVVIFNHDTSVISWTLINAAEDRAFDWPVTIGVSLASGEELLRQANATIEAKVVSDDYASFNGTSMASPHAAGVAALIWALAPTARSTEIARAMTLTARDLGAQGQDALFGNGLVDALNAGKAVAPAIFGLPSAPAPPVTSRRRATGTK